MFSNLRAKVSVISGERELPNKPCKACKLKKGHEHKVWLCVKEGGAKLRGFVCRSCSSFLTSLSLGEGQVRVYEKNGSLLSSN